MTKSELDAIILADVHAAVDLVREVGGDNPIVWLTGNSHMPPLRAWGQAESVWQADDDGRWWTAYAESFETMLENHNIYVACPEWDNALYAVDLSKWEYVESEEEGFDLQDDWQRKEVNAS